MSGGQQVLWAELLPLPPQLSSPVWIHSVQNCFELRVGFPFLHHGQVVAQRAQAGFELLVVQAAGFVLVKVPAAQSRGRLSRQALRLSPPPPAREAQVLT